MIALSAVCRGPDGPWGLSTLAAHPGGFERTVITRTAASDPRAFGVRAERVLRGDAASLSVDMGPDARLDVSLHDAVAWPRRAFGAIGLAHAIPWLPQYWHPVVLAAGVRGRVRAGDLALDLDGAVGYAEKNWGHGFPGRWWWGHAATFGDDDVSVSFAGGRIPLAGARRGADGGGGPAGPPRHRAGAAPGHHARRAGSGTLAAAHARARLRRRDRGRRRRRAIRTSCSSPSPPRSAASRGRASIWRAASRCGCGAEGACSTTAAPRSRGSSSACRSAASPRGEPRA